MSTVSNAKSLLTEIKFHHRSYYYILSLSLSLDDALVGSRVLFFDERAKKKKEEEEEAKKKNKSKISRILQRTMTLSLRYIPTISSYYFLPIRKIHYHRVINNVSHGRQDWLTE